MTATLYEMQKGRRIHGPPPIALMTPTAPHCIRLQLSPTHFLQVKLAGCMVRHPVKRILPVFNTVAPLRHRRAPPAHPTPYTFRGRQVFAVKAPTSSVSSLEEDTGQLREGSEPRRFVQPLAQHEHFRVFYTLYDPQEIVISFFGQPEADRVRLQFSVYVPYLRRSLCFVIFYPSALRALVSVQAFTHDEAPQCLAIPARPVGVVVCPFTARM